LPSGSRITVHENPLSSAGSTTSAPSAVRSPIAAAYTSRCTRFFTVLRSGTGTTRRFSCSARPYTSAGPPLSAGVTVPPETAAQKVARSLAGSAVSRQRQRKWAMDRR
jgi:hypothetical protein